MIQNLEPLETRKPEVTATEYVLPNFGARADLSAVLDSDEVLHIANEDAISDYMGGEPDALEYLDWDIKLTSREHLLGLIEDLQRLEVSLPPDWGQGYGVRATF